MIIELIWFSYQFTKNSYELPWACVVFISETWYFCLFNLFKYLTTLNTFPKQTYEVDAQLTDSTITEITSGFIFIMNLWLLGLLWVIASCISLQPDRLSRSEIDHKSGWCNAAEWSVELCMDRTGCALCSHLWKWVW